MRSARLRPALAAVVGLALAAPALAAEDPAVVRARAAATLRLADPGVLTRLLAEEADPLVRAAAAEAIGRLRDAATTTPLARTLATDAHPGVREEAARALARLAARTDPRLFARAGGEYLPDDSHIQRDRPLPPEAVSALARAAADPVRRVRAAALRALGQVGPPAAAATSAVVIRLEVEDDPALRTLAAQALGRLGDPAAAPALARALADRDGAARAAAARALGRLAGPPPVALFASATADRDGAVRASAIEALVTGAAEPASLHSVLVTALDDPDAAGRVAAADGLTRLADSLGSEGARRLTLADRLARERAPAARAALLALAARLDPAAAPAHLEALVASLADRAARRAAERGLVRLAEAGLPVAGRLRLAVAAPGPLGGGEGLAARALARVEARGPLVLPEARP